MDVSYRLLVAGSRGLKPTPRQFDLVLSLLRSPAASANVTVIHGTAGGVDTAGAEWGQLRGYRVEDHPADWDKHGKAAGYIRNTEMLSTGIDGAAIFWDGKSKGTQHTLSLCQSGKLPYVTVVLPLPEPTEGDIRHRETLEQAALDRRQGQLEIIERAVEEKRRDE